MKKDMPEPYTAEDQPTAFLTFLAEGGALSEANDISPEFLEAVYAMGHKYYTNGKYLSAIKPFQYLCFYQHTNQRNFLCLGACQQMLKLYERAIDTYSYAQHLDYSNPLPIVYIADCRLSLKDFDSAIHAYETAINMGKEIGFEHKEIKRALTVLEKIRQLECKEQKDG